MRDYIEAADCLSVYALTHGENGSSLAVLMRPCGSDNNDYGRESIKKTHALPCVYLYVYAGVASCSAARIIITRFRLAGKQ